MAKERLDVIVAKRQKTYFFHIKYLSRPYGENKRKLNPSSCFIIYMCFYSFDISKCLKKTTFFFPFLTTRLFDELLSFCL